MQISVAVRVREQISQLDVRLRDELIERVAEIADDPIAWLTRSTDPTLPGLTFASYASREVAGLMIALYFSGFYADPPRLELVSVAHSDGPSDLE